MVADAAANLTADAVLPTPPIYFGVGGCPSRFWEQENGPYRFRVVRGSSTGEVGADLVRTAAAHSLQTNGFFILEGDVEKPLLAPHDKDSASASLLPPATVAELQARFGLALDHMLDTANYVLENQPGLLDRNTTAGSHPFRAHADLHNREGRYDVETHRLPDPWYGFLSLPINRAFRDAVLPIVQPIFEKTDRWLREVARGGWHYSPVVDLDSNSSEAEADDLDHDLRGDASCPPAAAGAANCTFADKFRYATHHGLVSSFPGSPVQHWHTDGPAHYRTYTVIVPLVPITLQNGPTELVPGSHQANFFSVQPKNNTNNLGPQAAEEDPTPTLDTMLREGEYRCGATVLAEMAVGSILVLDYNVVHRGTPNLTQHVRPFLYKTISVSGSLRDPPTPGRRFLTGGENGRLVRKYVETVAGLVEAEDPVEELLASDFEGAEKTGVVTVHRRTMKAQLSFHRPLVLHGDDLVREHEEQSVVQ